MDLKNINHLKKLCEESGLGRVLINFPFAGMTIKSIFIRPSGVFLISVKNKNVGFSFPVDLETGSFSAQLPNDVYKSIVKKIKEHTGDNKPGPLFEALDEQISRLSIDILEQAKKKEVTKVLKTLTTTDLDFDKEGDSPYFKRWYRHIIPSRNPSENNLEKTERFFGKEMAAHCREARISSQWSHTPTEKALAILDPDLELEELNGKIVVCP